MTSAVALLCRRSTAPWMAVVYAGVLVAVTLTRDTWMYNALTAINWVTGGLLLALPLVAGAAAFDAWRFHRGDWRTSLLPTMRATRSLGWLAALHSAAILVAWLGLCVVAIAITTANGAAPQISLEMLAQPTLLCVFVACAGVTAGALVPHRWIAPAAAVGFFVLSVTAENYGPYRRFLMSLGFTAWSPYTQLDTTLLWLKCLALALLIVACVLSWKALGNPPSLRRQPRRASIALASAALIVVAIAGSVQPPGSNGILQQSWSGELACAGDEIQFCTNEPPSLAEPFAKAVQSAFASLEPYGIRPPKVYVDDRTIATGNPSAGAWSIDPGFLVEGAPAAETTAATVSRPAACREYYADEISRDSEKLLAASSLVFDFAYIIAVSHETEAEPSTTWADWHPQVEWSTITDNVGRTYAALSACDASQLPPGLP